MRERTFKRRLARKALVMLLLVMVVTTLVCTKTISVEAQSSSFVDLFTQRGGEGGNQSSDMFGPQETVQLYGQVLMDGKPDAGALVTFEIIEPSPVFDGNVFYRTEETNASGIAGTEFSLRSMGQDEAFGTWLVIATVDVAGEILRDFLTFRVDWTVEVLSARTIDANPQSATGFPPDRQAFGENGYVGVEITLRNNMISLTTANIAVSLVDELGTTVNYTQIEDLILPPLGRPIYIFRTMEIPKHTAPGNATVLVGAFNPENVSLSPQVSASLIITIDNPVFPTFRDDSLVYAYVYPPVARPGSSINATVIVRNEGTVTLNNISVAFFVDDTLTAEQTINSLGPYVYQYLNVSWNTLGFPEGNHTFSANVTIFPGEAHLTDNSYAVPFEIKVPENLIHDVAIINVTASPSVAYVGDNIEITVKVANLGDYAETFNVMVYYNGTVIFVKQVISLSPSETATIESTWPTSNVEAGTYRIRAEAEVVPGEVNTENNLFLDGQVTLQQRLAPSSTLFYVLILLLFLALLASLVLIMFLAAAFFLRRRRRRKKKSEHSYIILAHPHI